MFFEVKKTLKKLEFLMFFFELQLCVQKVLIKSGCFVCTGDDFFQNITFCLHETKVFNVVQDGHPCWLPEGTTEGHGQGLAAGLC